VPEVHIFNVFGCQKLFARPSFIIGNNVFLLKATFGHKLDELKFSIFADIPAYFIVIKIHVRIFWSENLKYLFSA
jgi:hypothetical protein